VPAEAARFRRRVRPRDLWFVGLVAGGLALGTPAAVLLADSGSASPRGGRCVTTIETGFMGGQTRRYCGRAAVTFCRQATREADAPSGCDAVLGRVPD
jgi:hypothetical protein